PPAAGADPVRPASNFPGDHPARHANLTPTPRDRPGLLFMNGISRINAVTGDQVPMEFWRTFAHISRLTEPACGVR
ncbi:hypothetical protein ACFUYE_29715, partial [Micromonospora humida]|uniref:hypothetical protein n=1 Tax=Micromonospora humida TaxID=2809018 RepID=UPI00366C1336